MNMERKVKTVFLLRHGKSAWDLPELDDMKRTLLPKGIAVTDRVAKYLKEINVKIDIIISSPAQRAAQTAEIIQQSMKLPETQFDQRLYPCSADEIYNVIIEQDDNIENILIVGHNPGLTYFAQEQMDADIDNLPTSGLVSCRYYTKSWGEFSISERKLNFVLIPKNL
jgi:phosphohistidine phosphatase